MPGPSSRPNRLYPRPVALLCPVSVAAGSAAAACRGWQAFQAGGPAGRAPAGRHDPQGRVDQGLLPRVRRRPAAQPPRPRRGHAGAPGVDDAAGRASRQRFAIEDAGPQGLAEAADVVRIQALQLRVSQPLSQIFQAGHLEQADDHWFRTSFWSKRSGFASKSCGPVVRERLGIKDSWGVQWILEHDEREEPRPRRDPSCPLRFAFFVYFARSCSKHSRVPTLSRSHCSSRMRPV